jgi:hypothetical protein
MWSDSFTLSGFYVYEIKIIVDRVKNVWTALVQVRFCKKLPSDVARFKVSHLALVSYLVNSSALKKSAVFSPESFVDFQRAAQCYIPEVFITTFCVPQILH